MLKHFTTTESFLRFLVWTSLAIIFLIDFMSLKIMGIKLVIDDNQIEMVAAVFICILLAIFIMPILAKKSFSDGFNRLSFGFKVFGYFIELMACFALFASLFVVFSYIAATSTRPLYDAEIFSIDRALGFDWISYISWINQHPMANDILKFAYHSSFQIPCLFFFLALTQKYTHLYSVMMCLIFSVIIVIGISAIFPTLQPFTYLYINIKDYPNVYMLPGYGHIEDLYNMRECCKEKTIILSNIKGVIGFPSFHTCISIILTWGFWSIFWLRVPFLLLNTLMLAAIPVSGGHYLTDMIAGAFIAISVIILVKKIVKITDNKFATIDNKTK